MAETVPLQQTVFEQGPQATFVPPAQQAQVYQEGQVVFGQPIYTVDPGIAWDALGAEAAKTASTLFENTLDYLISSKGNAVRELNDIYQTRLNDKYIELSSAQKSAKELGVAPDKNLIDGLIKETNEIQKEWRTKAEDVLENKKSVFLQPAIDYFSPALNIKDLGLKYQELALIARGTDRDITNKAQKMVFDAQLSGLFDKQRSSKISQAKAGNTSWDKKDNNTAVLMGALPIVQRNQEYPINPETNRPLFYDVDPTTGQSAIRLVDNKPLILDDGAGNWRFNPQLDYKTIIRSLDDTEFKFAVDMTQNAYPDSAVYSANGSFTPEIEEYIKDYFATDPNTRDPNDTWKIGYLLNRLPSTAIATLGRNLNLNATDVGMMNIAYETVRAGGKPTDTGKLKAPTPDHIKSAMAFFGTLSEGSLGNRPIQVQGVSAEVATQLVNNALVPIIAYLTGATEEEQQQLMITESNRTGQFGMILDQTPNQTFTTFMQTNQALAPVVIKAISYYLSNPNFLYNTDGSLKTKEELKEGINTFLATETTRNGLITTRNKQTGAISTIHNPDLLYMGDKLKADRQEAIRVYLTMPENRRATLVAGESPQQGLTRETLKSVANFAPEFNQNAFMALYDNLKVSVDGEGDVLVSREPPLGEILRMAVASSAMTWRKYGYDPKQTYTEEQKEEFAYKAWQDINPAHMWDVDLDLDNSRFVAYSQAEAGGLPISIKSITTKSGRNLMAPGESIIPNTRMLRDSYTPEMTPGVPAFAIHAAKLTPEQSAKFNANYNKAKAKLSAEVSPYTLVHADDAPASRPQTADEIIQATSTFAAIPQVTQAFAYSQESPILESTNVDQVYSFLVYNLDVIGKIAEKDPDLNKAVQMVVTDLGQPDNKRALFTKDNIGKMFVKAKNELGIKSNADFVSYILSVAQSKVANKRQPVIDPTMPENKLRSQMRRDLNQTKGTLPVSALVEKPFMLPSDKLEEFRKKLDKFSADNANDKNSWLIPLYDFPRLYFETGSIPEKLSDLPSKYALPGHPKYAVKQPSVGPTEAVLTADQSLGRGLEQVGENLLEPSRKYLREQEIKIRQEKLRAAMAMGNTDYFMAEMFKDPVATIRLQNQTQVQHYSTEAMNMVHLAFDPDVTNVSDEDLQNYFVEPETYQIAKAMAKAGWTAAALEYQVQQNLIKGKTGSSKSRDVNRIIETLSPTSFPLDENLKIRILADIRTYLETTNSWDKEAYNQVVKKLNDPTEGIPLKIEYLMATLSPGARTLDGTRDWVRIKGIAKRMIRGFN